MKQNRCPYCDKHFYSVDWYRRLGTCYPCGDALQKAAEQINKVNK